jgi:hypothetical protein
LEEEELEEGARNEEEEEEEEEGVVTPRMEVAPLLSAKKQSWLLCTDTA